LREGVYRHLKEREWLFRRLENDTVSLVHHSGIFGMGVSIEDIDWNKVLSIILGSYDVATLVSNIFIPYHDLKYWPGATDSVVSTYHTMRIGCVSSGK